MTGGRRWPVAPLIVLPGLLGIFLVPWFVPHRGPVASASYTLGFNNLVASLALAGMLAALFARRRLRSEGEGGSAELLLREMLFAPGPRAVSPASRAAFGAMTALTVALLFGWYRLLPYINFGEFGSDVSRLDLMVLGLRPYRDFQYNYGPAMLYPAFWLYQALGGRLSVDGAYCATLLAHWVAGLWLLHYTASTLCRAWHATDVFLCMSLAVLNFSMGVGYTPLRFVAPLASLLFLHRTFGRWVEAGTVGLPRCAALAALLSLASLSLSPEIGLATGAGIVAFFAALAFTPLRRFSVVVAVPPLALVIAVLGLSVSYADGIFSVGGGANNFPVLPTLAILLHLAAACVILPRLGAIGVRERNRDGALAIALVAGLGLLFPAAFGRCDQGHVLFNGLGVLMLFLALAVRQPSKVVSALTVGAFIFIHPVVANFLARYDVIDPFQDAIATRKALGEFDARHNEQAWQAAAGASGRLRYGKLLPLSDDLILLRRLPAVGTPFYAGELVDRFIKLSGRYSPEYYSGVNMQVYTPGEVRRKIRDLRSMDFVLVPRRHEVYPVVVNESDARFLSQLLFFPPWLIPGPRREPYFPGLEVVRQLKEDFTVVGEFRSFELWRRNAR